MFINFFIVNRYYLNWKVLDRIQDVHMNIGEMRANENALREETLAAA